MAYNSEFLKIGDEFNSFKAVEHAVSWLESDQKVSYWKRDSRTIKNMVKRGYKCVENDDLKYYDITYNCVKGGRAYSSKSSGARPNQRTFRDGCKSSVKFKLHGDKLVVHQLDTNHNHPVNEDWFKHLPKSRKFTGEEVEEISKVLQIRPNKKILQDHIRKTTGKCVTLRDLSNIAAKLKPTYNDLSDLLRSLGSDDKTLDVLTDEGGTLLAIYYQDSIMKEKYNLFPELIIADATYKLNDMRMTVFLQMIVDGNGESEIVSVFVLVAEVGDTMNYLLDLFKGHNPAWEQTKTILTDKDFTERGVYADKFPDAKLQLCLFHVLRSMKREINCEKMGIRSEEKNICLELIQLLAFSSNEQEYESNIRALEETGIQPVIDYINHSWHEIRNEWVIGLKHSCHYSNNTSNRVEIINQKIKQVISKFSNLKQFFDDLEIVIQCLRQERESRITNVIMKRNCNNLPRDDPKARFAGYLTPYAYQIVLKQMDLAQKVQIPRTEENSISIQTTSGMADVTSTSCSCQFTILNNLPCRHIFAFRTMKQIYLYFETGIDRRWTLDFYMNTPMSEQTESGNNNSATLARRPDVLSQTQKYRSAFTETQKLSTLISEGSTVKYKQRMTVLCKLIKLWENDKEAMVCDVQLSQEVVDMNSDEAKFVQNTINSNCVVIFSKTTCPYCSTAKQLFRDIGAPIEVVELDKRSDGKLIQTIVCQISGITTVPQVFIDGKCIGGCSETKSLLKNGQLITMLCECGIL